MLQNKNKPLATEGNYTDSSSDELVSGNEQSHVNEQLHADEQPPVDDANTKREIPEEQLAALEKYGLPRQDAKRLWLGRDRLLRNWQAMKIFLEEARPYLQQWEYEQQSAKQQGPEPRNPRGAGRKLRRFY